MAATTSQGGVRGTQIHQGATRSTISAAETNQLKSGSGTLGRVQVSNVGTTATLDIYDATSGTTNKFFEWVSADGKINHELNLPFGTGLRVITGGTVGIINIVWS